MLILYPSLGHPRSVYVIKAFAKWYIEINVAFCGRNSWLYPYSTTASVT